MTKNLFASLAILLALVMSAPVSANGGPTSPTLGGILLSDGNMFDSDQNDFDIVTQAVLAFPGLAGAATNPAATLTVFLPTDKAFRILVEDLYGESIKNESDLFDFLVTELTLPVIEAVLEYHIIGEIYTADDLVTEGDGFELSPLLEDSSLEVDFRGKQLRLIDNEPSLRDPIVRVVDIHGSNGVAHVIDRVLLP